MIDLLTNISSKTPIAMLPDVVNHNNEMIKSEIYPESIVNGTKTLPDNLKSLCNENGEIQRSINVDSENTFKINHGEVTNDLSVYGKVITNGVITKELTINEKLSFNKTALSDFIEKYRYAFSNILSDDLVESKLDAALSKKYPLYDNKTILEIKIDQYIRNHEELIRDMVDGSVNAAIQALITEINVAITQAMQPAEKRDIDNLFIDDSSGDTPTKTEVEIYTDGDSTYLGIESPNIQIANDYLIIEDDSMSIENDYLNIG